MSSNPIVLGMDFSDCSFDALTHASVIAKKWQSPLIIVHATPILTHIYPYAGMGSSTIAKLGEIEENEKAAIRTRLETIKSTKLVGVDASIIVATGDPRYELVNTAKEYDAQLIVVGSHGRRGVDRFIFGSVAEKISRHTNIDVLIARGTCSKPYQRLLFPTDFSPTSSSAIDVLNRLATSNSAITILHAVNMGPMFKGPETATILNDIVRSSEISTKYIANKLSEKGFKTKTIVDKGKPSALIVKLATEHDLIVIGSHGHSGPKRILLGSVAEKTIRQTTCSVYIARAKS